MVRRASSSPRSLRHPLSGPHLCATGTSGYARRWPRRRGPSCGRRRRPAAGHRHGAQGSVQEDVDHPSRCRPRSRCRCGRPARRRRWRSPADSPPSGRRWAREIRRLHRREERRRSCRRGRPPVGDRQVEMAVAVDVRDRETERNPGDVDEATGAKPPAPSPSSNDTLVDPRWLPRRRDCRPRRSRRRRGNGIDAREKGSAVSEGSVAVAEQTPMAFEPSYRPKVRTRSGSRRRRSRRRRARRTDSEIPRDRRSGTSRPPGRGTRSNSPMPPLPTTRSRCRGCRLR